MQGQYEIPDTERRSQLHSLTNRLARSLGALKEIDESKHLAYEEDLTEAEDLLEDALEEAREDMADLPEWDAELVRNLVLDHCKRSDTDVRRVDNEVVFEFEVGDYGDETECRYAVAVTSGNEWFHVRIDGEWEEVWQN